MQLWSVTIAQTRHRKLLVPAETDKAARRAVAATLGAHERVADVGAPVPAGPDTVTAQASLRWVLTRPFVLPGVAVRGATLGACARLARHQPSAAGLLAMAGLRWLEADDLFIGSAQSVPWLAGICDGTPLAGRGLTATLAALPGAHVDRVSRTLAGVKTRGLIVPRAVVLPLVDASEAA